MTSTIRIEGQIQQPNLKDMLIDEGREAVDPYVARDLAERAIDLTLHDGQRFIGNSTNVKMAVTAAARELALDDPASAGQLAAERFDTARLAEVIV